MWHSRILTEDAMEGSAFYVDILDRPRFGGTALGSILPQISGRIVTSK